MSRIAVIATGSIAAVKLADTLRLLEGAGYAPQPMLTEAARTWVTPASLKAACKSKAIKAERKESKDILHKAHAVLVAPASADFIAQLAHQDTPLARAVMKGLKMRPVMVSPAMNVMMWQHPATQRNVKALLAAGVKFIGPALGSMACGDEGYGRLTEPPLIVNGVKEALSGKKAGKVLGLYAKALVKSPRLPDFKGKELQRLLVVVDDTPQAVNVYPLISALKNEEIEVMAVLASGKPSYVTRRALAGVTDQPVATDHYDLDPAGMEHIRLPEAADAVLFAFAGKALIAAMAKGRGSDLAQCIYLASKKPVFLLPAAAMEKSTASQLAKDGVLLWDKKGK